MHSDPPSALLDRVRKLLAKAEAEGVTPPEAEALTAKAAELMARYGIDRARLAATRPDTDRPGSRIIDIDNPWAQVRAQVKEKVAALSQRGITPGLVRIFQLGTKGELFQGPTGSGRPAPATTVSRPTGAARSAR